MKYANFVHLHTHSQYSLLDGACRLDSVVELAKEYRMPALAITDHGNLFGAIEFYKKATRAGIKPIIGCETYVAAGSRFEKKPSSHYPDGGFHLVLLAKNETGYRNLIKLTTAAFLEGFYHRPRVDKELLRQHSQGLLATSACLKGEVNWHLLNGRTDEAVAVARELNDIFGDGNFFLEIQNHGLEKQHLLIPKVEAIARETGVGLVATNDCHYLHQRDSEAHDALLCIQTGKTVSDTDRLRYASDQIYFKSASEMEAALGDYKAALENTVHIAESCHLELELGSLKLPRFPIPKPFVDPDVYLRHLCEQGLKERYSRLGEEINKRLDYELSVIKQMGYAGYFLIVKDFCDYARFRKIRVGPGRGSAAGSLVSYALRITNIDPIKFDLLFERFLNPERVSMPDIDIDFADRGRDQIIQYVIDKYGKENVCQIITFGTMMARGVVRDVGRVLGMPYGEVDRIAKLVPERIGITLETALKEVPELTQLKESDPRVEKLLDYSITLEGLARHCSTHAAGVVIAPSALTNFVPLFKGTKDEITTQYDMKMVEEIGLLKMDFLGLRTLTVIDDTLRMVVENHGQEIDIDNVPLDDAEVYRIFANGDTIGIFQFESLGMRDHLRRLCPETFTDITVMNALYRPGPLDSGMITEYIERKRGAKKVEYLHPKMKEILGNTYGVIVFQEQVLHIANALAGYSMGSADLLRKAMGKKDASLMAAQKREFLKGTESGKIERQTAEEIFNQIETFARYGFNKAHSTCYAYIAYQTAWLKHHYPREFMAALMSSEINSTDRIYQLLEECRRMRIKVLPPDVNESGVDFSVVEGQVRFGLMAIKNVGEGPARAIVQEREESGPYSDLADLVSRVPLKSVNRRILESLIAGGACDSLRGHRAQQHAAVEAMLEFAHRVAAHQNSHDLFADKAGAIRRVAPPLPDIPDWSNSETLAQEKAILGFYISGHPLDKYRDELAHFTDFKIGELARAADGREVKIGGILTAVKKMPDKKGNMMAFATLEDFSGSVELILFSDCYDKSKAFVVTETMVWLTGRVSTREGEASKVIAAEVLPLEKLTERFNCQLVIKIGRDCADNLVDQALAALEENRGEAPVLLTIQENGSEVYIRSDKYLVRPDFVLVDRLKELLGESAVFLRPLSRKENFV
ncbi:MAG: DNA polymerase III subunit alpha [Candidatus Zixiibacteriota bacterium]|nr:MAG: DNA polymerase III subunit alpha [candidate division Zixibacteria bacterium]